MPQIVAPLVGLLRHVKDEGKRKIRVKVYERATPVGRPTTGPERKQFVSKLERGGQSAYG